MVELAEAGLYRRGTALALIVAPALFLIDNLIHPEEFSRGNELDQVEEIALHADRWQAAHMIGFAAVITFAAVILGLAFLVRRRQPRLGLWAGGAALVGLLGLAALIMVDGYTWGIVGAQATNPEVGPMVAADVLHEVQESGWALPYYLVPVGFLVGMAALAIGAARQGAIPVGSAALLVLATAMSGTETAIASNAYFIAGALVFLLAGVSVALPLLRMSDAEFLAGGR